MAKSKYLFQAPWPGFFLDGQLFELRHLNEYSLAVEDLDGVERRVIVTFSDHCFTEEYPEDTSQPQKFEYRESTRRPGYFCRRRYSHSLSLVGHIEQAKTKSVWNVHSQNLAILPVVVEDGRNVFYAIVFNLRRITGTPYHLRMDVASAYICDDLSRFETFGHIGFKNLVSLALRGKHPARNTSRTRKRPK